MRILLLDIETAPMKGWFWSLYNQNNIPVNCIEEKGYTLCFAAKWHKKREIIFDAIWKSGEKRMLKHAWKLVDEADAIVHYNGTKFDMPQLATGWLEHDLPPPSPYTDLDLLRLVRKRFRFPSNKLDYVCGELGLGGKVPHKGMGLWRGVMSGNKEDQTIMEKYNINDVRILSRLYKRTLSWQTGHPNWGLYIESDKPTCRNCGNSARVVKDGVRYSATQAYQRYRCQACGSTMKGRHRIKRTRDGVLS